MNVRSLVGRCLPTWVKRGVRRCIDDVAMRLLFRGHHPATGRVAVYYGQHRIAGLNEVAGGGQVKVQHMQAAFANAPCDFNLLYMVSSHLLPNALQLVERAQQRGVKLVWNQNGVAYPGWHGPGWEKANEPMKALLHAADHVFYQSDFCRKSADQFLGPRAGHSEVLYNPVDTQMFTPGAARPTSARLVLLLAGNQYQSYRLETALRTLAAVREQGRDAQLLVTGKLCWADRRSCATLAQRWLGEWQLADAVQFLGPYTQKHAAEIYRLADILLHTKYNDPCPGVVLEAMACGLPVVYSASGGVAELVGADAGIGVAAALSWEQDMPPDADALANAIMQVDARRAQYAQAARQRVVDRFDLHTWLGRHREVFEELCK